MVQNYIGGLNRYYAGNLPLAFFTYIAGGFGTNIDSQIVSISRESGVHGSAVSVANLIKMVENHSEYNHQTLRNLFSLDRQILLGDLK